MKLLIIYHAGLTDDAKDIFREYARQGIDLTVIVPSTFHSPAGSPLLYDQNDDERAYRFVPLPFKVGFAFLPLFDAVKAAKPDVIHVFDEYSSIYLAQTLLCRNIIYGKKVPVFAYAFQNIPFAPPAFLVEVSLRAVKRLVYKLAYPLIFWYHKNNVTGVSGCNQEALQNISNINPGIPTRLIFWGVNIKKFFKKDKVACREALALPKDIKLIGYFGRIIEEKGLDVLLCAAAKTKDWYVLLVGDGGYKNSLVGLVDALGIKDRVFFRPSAKQADLVDFYNALDAFALPSETIAQWKEQYGRVLVEAMACGLPIIGSSSGAIGQVLEGYPKGFIFNEGDVQGLAEKISLAADASVPVGFNAITFLDKFSVEHFVREHIVFYKKHTA